MLIKEYRILLPMTVQEYRIAQLYMIQKKSRLDSHGKDSGVEIISNKPYTDGPGKAGQYTFKIYHIGSRIPAWIRTVLPTNALEAHEEAWNAYPVTKTRYSTPMMDRFSLEVETLYYDDAGEQDNVFNLSEKEKSNRVVDYMDFVKDAISSHDYTVEEDPKLFKSEKTGRGPLTDDWVEEHKKKGLPIMCAYKLCKVEFRYWGMQTRAERWIHDLALRNTMLRAHRQAWAWQDEWTGLTMKDIRKLEAEAALHLSKVMAVKEGDEEGAEDNESDDDGDAVSDDLYFDACDTYPMTTQKPSIIRWSSELELEIQDENSPPLTPHNGSTDTALLIMVFHGDFSPDNPADSKTTDTNTFGSTIETCVQRHYPQLRNRLHIVNVSCGCEMTQIVNKLSSVSPSFGLLHPSLSLMLPSANQLYNDAVEGTIRRANETYNEFIGSQPLFNGEVFVVGDCVGGIFLYEALTKKCDSLAFLKRLSSNVSSKIIKEHKEESPRHSITDITITDTSSTASYPLHNPHTQSVRDHSSLQNGHSTRRSARNYSAPPSASYVRKKISLVSVDSVSFGASRLNFQPSTVFLLGCPLGLTLMQRKLEGLEIDCLDSCQLFNLYYPLDPCGARIEPVLDAQLSIVPPYNVPKYQRYPLGDGKSQKFDSTIDTSQMWGSKRIDNLLYCPNSMVALPSSALPNILHASYWESCDVASFLLRQFVRGEESMTMTTLSSSMNNIPLNIDLPPMHWKRKRTRFKIANLSSNHRANDLLVTAGMDLTVTAKFCYGPMDLVALSREAVSVFVCPQRGDWYLHGVFDTDSHGRLTVQLAKTLPCGIHSIKIVVHGDRSYLDAFVAIVPHSTKCVVFSVDGSLTASVSVTGKDPRVRPGAVDVVRYWQEQGYLIIYLTARPDMQQKVVSAWLAQHNFPHALLFFNNSFSTEPLKQKSLHLRHFVDMGVHIHVAYGSSKDVSVYTSAGVDPEHVISVAGSRRSKCLQIENYSSHLSELSSGHCALGQRIEDDGLTLQLHRNVQRTPSFTPRGGKFENEKERR